MKDSEFYSWARSNQPNNQLTQLQVDQVSKGLSVIRAEELQLIVAALTGWSINGLAVDEVVTTGGMLLSKRGADMMKRYEGFRSAPYRDMVGVWTVGYGNTYYPDRSKVKATDAHLTEPQAAQLAMDIINLDFSSGVNKLFADEIASGKLNQNMFDALVSLAYNIGIGALSKSNSVTGNIKKGNYKAAADGFLLWDKGRVNGKLQPINGLTRRRKEERELFLS